MSTSLPNGSYVFVNQLITISCTTTGSHVLAWQSDEYTGPNVQVALTSNGDITGGEIKNGSVGFINVQGTGQQIQISSKLCIVVLPGREFFTIKCRNIDLGDEANVTFQLYGMYMYNSYTYKYYYDVYINFLDKNATELEVPNNESNFCPGDYVTVSCNVRNSNSSRIRMSDAHNNTSLEVQCGDSENQLIQTTFDENPIINTSFSDNIGDGSSSLNCTVSLRAEQLSRNEPSLFVSCLNPEIGLQANKTLEFRGK